MRMRDHLIKAYLFIKENRVRRKVKIYKMALGVMVDKTIAVYLLLLLGYVFVSFFILGDVLNGYYDSFRKIEAFGLERMSFIIPLLTIRYVMNSFSKPGVLFSSSEYQLSILPFARNKVWLLCVIEKWIKSLIVYVIFGTIIVLVTPIQISLVYQYLGLFILMNMLLTIPQWKLYQVRFLTKVYWLVLSLLLSAVGVISNTFITVLLFTAILLVINIILMKKTQLNVKWDKVTEWSDFKIWDMAIVSRASGVKLKRHKKYSLLQNTKRRKRPFQYTEKNIQKRLWSVYLVKNYEFLIQLIGALLVMLFVFIFLSQFLFYLGIAITIHIYTSSLAAYFTDRFDADILRVLPWNLTSYKNALYRWAIIGAIVLGIPVITFLLMYGSFVWVPLQLLYYTCVFMFIYHVKVDKSIELLGKTTTKTTNTALEKGFGYALLIGVVFSGRYSIIALGFIPILFLLKSKRRIL